MLKKKKKKERKKVKDPSFEGPILVSIFSYAESTQQHEIRVGSLGLAHWGENAKAIEAAVCLLPREC